MNTPASIIIMTMNFHLNLFLKSLQLIRMVPIGKSLVFLCMLIRWSQAFPYHNVTTEDKTMKDVDMVEKERQDAILRVSASFPHFVCTDVC